MSKYVYICTSWMHKIAVNGGHNGIHKIKNIYKIISNFLITYHIIRQYIIVHKQIEYLK